MVCNESNDNLESKSLGVALEIFKVDGDKCLKSLTNIFNTLFKDKLPEELMMSSLVPVLTWIPLIQTLIGE